MGQFSAGGDSHAAALELADAVAVVLSIFPRRIEEATLRLNPALAKSPRPPAVRIDDAEIERILDLRAQ